MRLFKKIKDKPRDGIDTSTSLRTLNSCSFVLINQKPLPIFKFHNHFRGKPKIDYWFCFIFRIQSSRVYICTCALQQFRVISPGKKTCDNFSQFIILKNQCNQWLYNLIVTIYMLLYICRYYIQGYYQPWEPRWVRKEVLIWVNIDIFLVWHMLSFVALCSLYNQTTCK